MSGNCARMRECQVSAHSRRGGKSPPLASFPGKQRPMPKDRPFRAPHRTASSSRPSQLRHRERRTDRYRVCRDAWGACARRLADDADARGRPRLDDGTRLVRQGVTSARGASRHILQARTHLIRRSNSSCTPAIAAAVRGRAVSPPAWNRDRHEAPPRCCGPRHARHRGA